MNGHTNGELRSISSILESPSKNGFIESLDGKLRHECLDANQFLSIDDARSKYEAWHVDYNVHRPHSSLGQLSPNEFLRRSKTGTEKPSFSGNKPIQNGINLRSTPVTRARN